MKKQTYSNALKELKQIVERLESNNEINMDELNVQVKKASELIAYCKKELTQISSEVQKIVDEIQ